jgi:hypothetical protein
VPDIKAGYMQKWPQNFVSLQSVQLNDLHLIVKILLFLYFLPPFSLCQQDIIACWNPNKGHGSNIGVELHAINSFLLVL